jgi:phosphoglycolate phosphatase-like HAD superfamily hydrolase/ADP-ribose pyrophosphatase YjhB (NUDIX family)
VIRNLIFDWSGTLVDDLPAVLQASNFVLTQSGRPVMSLAQFRAEFQLPFSKFYEKHTPDLDLDQLEQWFHAEFRNAQGSVVALPHAREFLQFCRDRGMRMFLLSSIRGEHFMAQNRSLGFDSFLEKPYTDIWDKREKIHELLRDHHLTPDETLFIGDMEHDIATAHHGGIHSCAVLTGYNTLEQLRAAKPDLIVEHLEELRRVLLKNKFHLQPVHPEDNVEPPLATVGALIFNAQDEVLMIRTHKWSGKWGIPGGKIKRGEKSETALRRELKEETGLNITDIEFVLVQDCISSKEFYRDAHFVLLNYTCRAVARHPRVVLNEEAREFQWLPLAQAKKLKLNKPTKILLDAVGKLGGTRVPRVASGVAPDALTVQTMIGRTKFSARRRKPHARGVRSPVPNRKS